MMVLIDHAELRKRIYAGRFLTTLFHIDVEGTKHRVIPRDFQLDPVKDLPMHVDFLRVAEGAVIRVNVAVKVLNADQSPGVKRGGAVNIVTHTIEVMCPVETHSGIDRRRYFRARHQPFQAPQRRQAAAERARDRAWRHHAGHGGAAVRLRGRNEGRRRSGCCRRCRCRRRCCRGRGARRRRCGSRCSSAWRRARCCARWRSGRGGGCRRRAGQVRQEVRGG